MQSSQHFHGSRLEQAAPFLSGLRKQLERALLSLGLRLVLVRLPPVLEGLRQELVLEQALADTGESEGRIPWQEAW